VRESLSHYEIEERIGAGGMGEVFRARDSKLGREVALKILPPALAADPERPNPAPDQVAWPRGWSPDGKRFVAIGGKPEADDVYVGLGTTATGEYEIPQNADGEPFHLRLNGHNKFSWLNKGLGILFFEDSRKQLLLYDPDTKKATVLLENEPNFFTSTATRDGGEVVIETYDRTSDVWLVTLK
jgi:serine/threonine protein kinase